MSFTPIQHPLRAALRTCSRCSRCPPTARPRILQSRFTNSISRRSFSSSHPGPTSSATTPAPAHASAATFHLTSLTSELDQLSPRFDILPSQVLIIQTPAEFYSTLKDKIRNAKHRVFLSTLYIGKSEHELISTLQQSLRANPNLKVSILTDALRGTRETPNPSCASLLVPLVAEFGDDRVDIRMFHTPNLTGVRKKVVPKRINEGWGLQHMKLYGVDDEIILSGANLSSDYFTNRQDRYHLISSPDVTDYFANVHHSICRLSFKIRPTTEDREKGGDAGYTSTWEPSNEAPSPLENPSSFISASSKFLAPLTAPGLKYSTTTTTTQKPFSDDPSATSIYPLLQLTPLMKSPETDTSNELPTIRRLFTALSSPQFVNHRWVFTAGYFNMTPEVRSLLLATNPASGTVIAASPWANGFYGSSGVSGMLPAAYTLMARRFVEAVTKAGIDSSVSLLEWRNGTVNQPGGWTYHAKGFWLTLPTEPKASSPTSSPTTTQTSASQSTIQDAKKTEPDTSPIGPCLTIVGSSNYTKRSHTLDLEANALIVTRDHDLQRRLGDEVANLKQHAKPVTIEEFQRVERRVSLHVRVAMWLVSVLGGAL